MSRRGVLLVDDEALFRTSAADSLRVRFPDIAVWEAEDGSAGIELLDRESIDVVITDLQMPQVGGLELVHHIARHRYPVQVIVVSAHIDESSRNRLDELGTLACIDKPIELEALHNKVERMLAVPQAHVRGVALSGFLQLLEMERQTCGIRVTSPDGDGMMVFEQGQLLDAWTGDQVGDAAAIAVLRFHACTLDVVTVLEPTSPRTTLPLSFLMLEAARLADEDQNRRDDELVSGVSIRPEGGLELHAASVRPPSPEQGGAPLIRAAMSLRGALAAVLVDAAELTVISHQSHVDDFDVCAAALANAELYRKQVALLSSLGVEDTLEEVLIAQPGQFHILRPFSSADDDAVLFMLVDRTWTNLALTRNQIGGLENFYTMQRARRAAS